MKEFSYFTTGLVILTRTHVVSVLSVKTFFVVPEYKHTRFSRP
jgi:hypothetical protein